MLILLESTPMIKIVMKTILNSSADLSELQSEEVTRLKIFSFALPFTGFTGTPILIFCVR